MSVNATILALLVVFPGLAPAAPQQAGSGAIRGTVRGQMETAVGPLAFALVEVADTPGGALTAVADQSGSYALRNVPVGRRRLRALHVGYRTLEVEVLVPADGTVVLDLELEREPVRLAPITVWGELPAPILDTVRRPATSLAEATLRALEASPGLAELGLAAAARSAAGGEPPDPSDVLFMRGSTADLKLVLLDGAPVYTPFHLGGLLPSFEATTLRRADLYVGGAPARYDGGLSYILDLRTRAPGRDRLRSTVGLDFLGARLAVEAPAGSHAALGFTSRALHRLADGLLWSGRSPYGYLDALARLELEPRPGQRVSATGFWNRESVYLDLSGAGAAAGPVSRGADDARWGNNVLALGYEGSLGSTAIELRGAFTRYDARLPLAGVLPRIARGTSERTRFAADLRRELGSGVLRYGASFDHLATEYGARALTAPDPTAFEVSTGATAAGGYVEGEGPLGLELRIRGGLRLDHFSTESGVRAAPRLAVTWLLTEDALVTLALGRYHQLVRNADTLVRIAAGDTAVPAGEPILPVASGSHVVLALDQLLTPGLHLGLEGFVKRFTGTTGADGAALNASGIDLRILRQGPRATAWLGYSLTWYWEAERTARSRFQGRHLLSAGVTGRVAERAGIDLRLAFGDGLPYTTIPVSRRETADAAGPPTRLAGREIVESSAPLAGGPTEDFLRLDLEVFGILRPGWAGRRVEIRPYAKLLNALDRRDALFYYFEPWHDPRVRPVAELSFLPVVGMEWTF
ncbi:MAG: TonB-dependent receptor [Gemmatimonadetes bacterium]|nr:TonB-dependent receptor [Gemmatimonadota bacterium]